MKFTAVRCYVLLELAAKNDLEIRRNGAQEPSIALFEYTGSPFSQKRCLTAAADLYKEGLIDFEERGLHGVYKGKAKLTNWGKGQLDRARDAQIRLAELAQRHAAERAELERRRAEEIAAFEKENPAPVTKEPTSPIRLIRVCQLVGDIAVEDVQPGWEIQHKGRWYKVILVREAAVRAHHPNYQLWSVYIEGRNRPLRFTVGTEVVVMAPVERPAEGPEAF